MVAQEAADRIEGFVRERFAVSADDARFTRATDLFEEAYVDSIGLTELLAFIEREFGVEVPDEALLSDAFSTIDGIAGVVTGRVRAS